MIKKSIHKSQHCQRNWDLNRQISEEDLQVLETAVTACPSKQNIVFYKPYFIQDRNVIEQIHATTNGFTVNYETGENQTNSQTLANLLVVLVEDTTWFDAKTRNVEMKNSQQTNVEDKSMQKNKLLSVGVAAGYLNLTATMLGFSTGCCTCFNGDEIQKILGIDDSVMLLMGIGYPDDGKNRREHHSDQNFMFPTFSKKMNVTRI